MPDDRDGADGTVVLGYCPLCGAPGVARERTPGGNDLCRSGHAYPSSSALAHPPEATPGPEDDTPGGGA